MKKYRFVLILLAFGVAACTTATESNPPRTATEQLLISTAADRATRKLVPNLPQYASVYIDATNFEGTDSKYAVAAIRAALMKRGARLVDAKKDADTVVELRAGALSTDKKETLIGMPAFNVPVPFASSPVAFPEIALYSKTDQMGVAKFAAVAYDAKSGALSSAPDPEFGFAHNMKKTVLIFISWSTNDTIPADVDQSGQ